MPTLQAELDNEFAGKTVTITPSADNKEWTIKVDDVEETVPAGKDGEQKQMTVAEAKSSGKVFDGTEDPLVDNYSNEIIVPKGFKIVEGTNVTDGIVIQDESAKDNTSRGNQFVWIPVGTVYTNKDKTESKIIELDRYFFEENPGNVDGIKRKVSEQTEGYLAYVKSMCIEESASRLNESGKNATAKNLNSFLSEETKGFYIGRYEARVQGYSEDVSTDNSEKSESWTGYIGGSLVEKKNAQVYNYITQNKAAELSREMYGNLGNFESDLMNSYAWDTATLFLQEFDDRDENARSTKYSAQKSVNQTGYEIEETGTTIDKVCNIYDMSSNCYEWTTETWNTCVFRGGSTHDPQGYTSYRGSYELFQQRILRFFSPYALCEIKFVKCVN